MSYVIVDSTGEVVKSYSGPAEFLELNTPTGCTAIDASEAIVNSYWDGNSWVLKPSPLNGQTWDATQKMWVDLRPLELVKYEKWTAIKESRAYECEKILQVGDRTFDATPISQQQINGAVTLAMLAGSDWTIDWTLADNTTATLSKAEMIAVGVALGQRTNEIYSYARTLRENINNATTSSEVEAVTWNYSINN